MQRKMFIGLIVTLAIGLWAGHWLGADQGASDGIEGWTPGKGWGWVWGADDEVGSLNAMSQQSVTNAAGLITKGKVYDLGISFDRDSYKWPGHNPTEIMSFRTPEGVKRQKDFEFHDTEAGTAWHSCALFISDNVATQIDGLGHLTTGKDNHWYNGFKEADWGGDWGVRKCDATTIPPVVTRGVLIDIAGFKGVDSLPAHYGISVEDITNTLKWEGVELRPGDTVLIRTGTLRYWGENGSDHEKIGEADSAGLTLAATKFLVEDHGAIMVGSDTSGLEQNPPPPGSKTFAPVHEYLLIEQGVHIAEFNYLEDLSRDKVYEFCYIALVNKIRGVAAGFCMRPIAVR